MTKKQQLLAWIQNHRWMRTSDVIRWGVDNYFNRAERTMRDLAQEGFVRRATEEEKARMFVGKMKQDVWIIV